MDNAEHITTLILIINSCIESCRFEFSILFQNLLLISGIGSLVKNLSRVEELEIPREDNNEPISEPIVLENLQEMKGRIDDLFEKSKDQLKQLKCDIDKKEFLIVFDHSSFLVNLLTSLISKPDPKMYDNLRQEYQKKALLSFANTIKNCIEDDYRNPIICEMDKDNFKRKETFEKWSKLIDSLLSQLLFLETFCCGLFCNEDLQKAEILKSEIVIINSKITELKKKYKNDSSYWKYIKDLVYKTQENNVHLGNQAKSEILKDRLNTILTNDSFFVLVYDHCEKTHRHAYRYSDDQAVVSFNRGNCNVAVYRSRHWNSTSESEKEKIREEVKKMHNKRVPWSQDYHEFLDFCKDVVVHNAGFLAMVRTDRDIAVRIVNCENGPGAYTTLEAGNDKEHSGFTFFAGFN